MLKKDVLEYFENSSTKVANALGYSSHSAVCQWEDIIPEISAFKLERITGGDLVYIGSLYGENIIMSDPKINRAVAEKRGHTYIHDIDKEAVLAGVNEDGKVYGTRVNYCNEWGHAGHIIEKYKIVLDHSDPRTLRAAMLCFLEMEI